MIGLKTGWHTLSRVVAGVKKWEGSFGYCYLLMYMCKALCLMLTSLCLSTVYATSSNICQDHVDYGVCGNIGSIKFLGYAYSSK